MPAPEERRAGGRPRERRSCVYGSGRRRSRNSRSITRGLHVWPTHIMLRPESDFKNRLMHVLGKPFSQEEYDKLVGCATIRKPATKERRTREGVKYYLSDHEVNKSYFDRYPDLEEQVKSTSYPNQLALLRGFFFWLKNVWHEDQFRPWRDDFLQYKVVPIIE